MSLSPISFIASNFRDNKNEWLKAYEPGTTTPKSMALDTAGAVTVAKLQLNADGFIVTAGAALVIPYIDSAYDLWLFPTEADADANDTSSALRLANDMLGVSGLGAKIAPMTLAEAVANTSAIAGQIVQITDRADAQFEYKTGQTPNTYNIVAADASGLDLVLRNQLILDIDMLGAIADAGGDNTDNTGAIAAATAIGGKITLGNNGGNGNGIYSSQGVTVTNDCDIDLNGNVIARTTGTGGFFGITGFDFSIKNGTLDPQNLSNHFGHTLIFNGAGKKFHAENMTFQNNIEGFGSIPPTALRDIDHVSIESAGEVLVENCTFFRASRQGISITAPVPKTTIKNNHFEDCYLFGVDIEPNSPATFMYDEVTIHGNTFKNCGPKSETDFVHISGGPIAIASAIATSVIIVRTLNFYDNIIISSDFLNTSLTRVEPFAKLDSYQTLNFSNNEFDNLDRIIIATIDATTEILNTVITNNKILSTFGGNMQGNLICLNSDTLLVNGSNELRSFTFDADETVIIDGNFFKDAHPAIKASSTDPTKVIITDNGFTDCTTCIDTTNLTTKYTIIGNQSTGDTTFCLAVTDSTVALNQSDGVNANGQFKASSNTIGEDFTLGSPNGVQVKYSREDTAVVLDDVYFKLEAHSDHTSTPGLVGSFACIKDISNANAYGAWELFSGLSGALVSHLYSDFDGNLLPSRDTGQDNLQDLGSATIRWATVFAGTGAIDTSDGNEKQQIELLTIKEKAVAIKLKSLIRTFKFNDAVEIKGSDARIHCGVIAQDVLAAFDSEGLNGANYALFCSDTFYTLDGKVCNILDGDEIPDDAIEKTRLGIRYSELLAFIISAM